MEGLPKLPGLSFTNPLKTNFTKNNLFHYVNGYQFQRPVKSGIGGEPPIEQSIAFIEKDDAILYDPVLTYGRVQKTPAKPFRPDFVIFDKMALTFKAFFKQGIPESPLEHYRVRFVNIIYFLDDNSITVMEPEVKNCGFPQGRLVRRGKIPKNIKGECYSWKDFNIGMDIELNGIVFHIIDCDQYTKDFMFSQGIELNDPECPPIDPYTTEQLIKKLPPKLGNVIPGDDKLRRFLEFQGKILRFEVILDETDIPQGEVLTYRMFYFLEDDTVSIKELEENQEGRDHFPMLLRRTKLPKNWKHRPRNYPSIYLELSDREVEEYYQPKDFKIGDTIYVFGRRFLILDCDKFTRKYFSDVLKQPQKERLCIKFPEQPVVKRPIPDYLGLGSPEDSLASCYALIPKPPKKDIIKYIINANKFLRYGCVLDSAHPEDHIRKFILSYSLADDTIQIMEPPIRNSGIIGGKFLNAIRVKIPGCDRNNPIYYGPKDFYIGAILKIFDHRFKIVSADLYVYHYMQKHPELFTKEAISSVQKYLLTEDQLKDEVRAAILKDMEESENANQAEEKEAHKAILPTSDMEQCLREINVYDNTTSAPIEDLKSMVRQEKRIDRDPNECPYEVKPVKILNPDSCNEGPFVPKEHQRELKKLEQDYATDVPPNVQKQ